MELFYRIVKYRTDLCSESITEIGKLKLKSEKKKIVLKVLKR